MRDGKWVFKEAYEEENLSSLLFAGVRLRVGPTGGLCSTVLGTSSVTSPLSASVSSLCSVDNEHSCLRVFVRTKENTVSGTLGAWNKWQLASPQGQMPSPLPACLLLCQIEIKRVHLRLAEKVTRGCPGRVLCGRGSGLNADSFPSQLRGKAAVRLV